MIYATAEDITALYGEDALSRIADRDGDYAADLPVIEAAIARAVAEIDSYLAVRFALPLPHIPEILRQLAADIAIYRMAVDGGALRDEHRTRYEDAVKLLQRLADGKASLPMPAEGESQETPEQELPRPIVTHGPSRIFTRQTMRGL